MKKVLLWFALMASVACAQQVATKGQDAVITHVVDGDGWQTWITLSNLVSTPSLYLVSFFQDDGTPLQLTTDHTTSGNGTVVFGTIPGNGSVTVKSPGTSATLTEGWAKVQTVFNIPGGGVAPGATIAGTALFLRPQNASRPTETSEPLDFSQARLWAIPFDHTNGYTTGLALLNQTNTTATVSMVFYDESGVILLTVPDFTLASGQHQATVLTSGPTYTNVVGRRGTLLIRTNATSINVLGMRSSPTGDVSGIAPTSW